MGRWRAFTIAGTGIVASIFFVAATLEFLAPDLAYQIQDRIAERFSADAGRKYRIALGAITGSSYRVGTVLNRYLNAERGYELELLVTASPGNIGALLDPNQRIDLATINSADDEAARADGVYGVAALDAQYFFVIVPNPSPVREFRDLTGAINPGVREPGQPPTLGERVLEYYGLLPSDPAATGTPPRVSVVRPRKGILADFESGSMAAVTRTQFLRAGMIDDVLRNGQYRLVPIRDHEALAKSLPGTRAAFIPAGLYGPDRRIPPEAVPTVAATQLLVARGDVPGRVIRDILEVIYDPRFARDLQFELTEQFGRNVGGLPLHRAAEIYYHRNDLPTSDLLGRLSFVASAIAGLAAMVQFVTRYRRNERLAKRRQLLASELAKLQAIRRRVDESTSPEDTRELLRDADDILGDAEQDAAAGLLDGEGIQALRSVHRLCRQSVVDVRVGQSASGPAATAAPPRAARVHAAPQPASAGNAESAPDASPPASPGPAFSPASTTPEGR